MNIFKTIKDSKRLLFLSLLSMIIVFCIVLNFTFSAFTQSTNKRAADLTVSSLVYSKSVNGNDTDIISAPAEEITRSNVVIVAENAYNTKYEITYEVCTDSACNNVVSKPSDFEVYYSSKTVDSVSGSVTPDGTKKIRLVIKNDTNTDYYIRIGINSGYAHNALTLTGQISEEYVEDDLIVKTIINGNEEENFPTTHKFDTSVNCVQLDNKPINTTGRVLWDGDKWVFTVYNLTENRTQCTVNFTTGVGPTVWYTATDGELVHEIRETLGDYTDTWTIPGEQPSYGINYKNNPVDANYQVKYITYADGYTQDSSTGLYTLTGVHTVLYSSGYENIRGKYTVGDTLASVMSDTNTSVNTSNIGEIYQFTATNLNNCVIRRVKGVIQVSSTQSNYYFTYGEAIHQIGDETATKFEFLGTNTLKYSENYRGLIGKYIPSFRLSGIASETDTLKDASNITVVVKVIDAKPNYIEYVFAEEAVLGVTQDELGSSFYLRGNPENNYLVFAGMCWRITRIESRGGIRVALYSQSTDYDSNPCSLANADPLGSFAKYDSSTAGQNGASALASGYNANAYIGYMYGTARATSYANEHANTNRSVALQNLMKFYDLRLKAYDPDEQIVDAIWFNDKTVASASFNPGGLTGGTLNAGFGTNPTYYSATERMISSTSWDRKSGATPTLRTTDTSNLSRYTTKDNYGGNDALPDGYKIGLLSFDELNFAGLVSGINNSSNFLVHNAEGSGWWSLSPAYFNGSEAFMWRSNIYGLLASSGRLTRAAGLKAAIVLEPSLVTTGSGTQNDPFVVSTVKGSS